MKKRIGLLFFLLFFMTPLACNWSTTAGPTATATQAQVNQPNVSITRYSPDVSSGEATQTPFVPEATLEPLAGEQPAGVDAATPEELIYTVLTHYDTDPDWMRPYLSDDLWEVNPSGSVNELLGLEGDLEGLVFQAGSTAAAPDQAYVEVALQVNGVQTYRVFTLVKGETGWLIDSIKTIEPE